MATLKAKVMAALRNADGTPIKELNTLIADQSIIKNLENVFDTEILTSKDLLNIIDAKFNNIFKISE